MSSSVEQVSKRSTYSETKGSWERVISDRDQRAEIENQRGRKMGRNGKGGVCDGSGEVNLINGENCHSATEGEWQQTRNVGHGSRSRKKGRVNGRKRKRG
jgi:hypothetical protein